MAHGSTPTQIPFFTTPDQLERQILNNNPLGLRTHEAPLPVPGTRGGVSQGPLSGGGFGSGGSAADRIPNSTRRETLLGGLRTSGFALPFDVSGHIRATVAAKGGMTMLLNRILDDPRFEAAFPGIFDKDGVLKMTPAEYRATEEAYKDAAAVNGLRLNKRQVGEMIGNNVSPDEAAFRFNAVATIKDNKQVFNSFNAQIRAANRRREEAGLPKLPTLDKPKDALNFVTGKAPRGLYLLYEGAAIDAAATSAGLDISTKRARRLAKKPGQLGLEDAEQRFSDIAAALRLGDVELASAGLTQRDLEIIEFGGKNRVELAARAERVLGQRENQLSTNRGGLNVSLDPNERPTVHDPLITEVQQ